MKLYALVCINEKAEVVDVHIYTSKTEATSNILTECEWKRRLINPGSVKDCVCNFEDAYLSYGRKGQHYKWTLKEVDC